MRATEARCGMQLRVQYDLPAGNVAPENDHRPC